MHTHTHIYTQREDCVCVCVSEDVDFVVVAGMATRNLGGFLVLVLAFTICEAASVFQPISDSHRSVALELFAPAGGSFGR